MKSLQKVIKSTGQDIHLCRDCQNCNKFIIEEMDISFSSMIEMIMINDVELFTCRTIWSEKVFLNSKTACRNGINFQTIISAIREEANSRGIS